MDNQLFLCSVLADSTLKRMTKAELIKRIRCLENERKDLIARIIEAKNEAINGRKISIKAREIVVLYVALSAKAYKIIIQKI